MMLWDYWYVAAWASEVSDVPLARTVLGEPVVIFRVPDNRPVVLRDRCPHRGLPLSKGSIVEGRLQCGYHGLEFDGSGTCVKVPGQNSIPPGAVVKSYPAVEKWGWVWVWMGDPARADPATVPDFHWLDDPAWVAATGEFTVAAGHELLLENLHNHAHLQFVHRSTIGTDDIIRARSKIRRIGDEVHIERWLFDRPAPPLFAEAGGFTGQVDRWFNSVFMPPTNVVLDIGCADTGTGAPEGDRSRGIEIRSLHSVTPISERLCRYFWAYVRNFSLGDDAITDLLRVGAHSTFEEDVDVLEAQQTSLDWSPGETFIDIATDAGPMQLKRVLADLQARQPATAS